MSKDPAVFVRRSTLADLPSLACLAAASGGVPARHGRYLVAEVKGDIVAAASLDSDEALASPSMETNDIRELLTRWAANLRRHAPAVSKAA